MWVVTMAIATTLLAALPLHVAGSTVCDEAWRPANRSMILAFIRPASETLTSVPDCVFDSKFSGMNKLSLAGNRITSIPPEIGSLTNLTDLFFHRNEITSIPPQIGDLKKLKNLKLFNNQITSIPPEIGNLKNLETLDILVNQITSIPREIGNLAELTKLNLRQNKITSIPPEIGNLKNLETLLLNRNKITSIPSEIGKLTSLEYLDVELNEITSIPSEIGNLIKLTRLRIPGNPIERLPVELIELNVPSVQVERSITAIVSSSELCLPKYGLMRSDSGKCTLDCPAELASKDAEIALKNAEIALKNAEITSKNAEIFGLKNTLEQCESNQEAGQCETKQLYQKLNRCISRPSCKKSKGQCNPCRNFKKLCKELERKGKNLCAVCSEFKDIYN